MEVNGNDYDGNLTKRAYKISKILQYGMGRGRWQVMLIKGNYAKKFACSCHFYCTFRKKDGLVAFIWLNRFFQELDAEVTTQI
jgi:hypothetical protein